MVHALTLFACKFKPWSLLQSQGAFCGIVPMANPKKGVRARLLVFSVAWAQTGVVWSALQKVTRLTMI